MTQVFPEFERRPLTFDGVTRDVFCGGQGPAVIVMHEVPGLHPGVVDFARRVTAAGFTVYMPSMVGTPGRAPNVLYAGCSLVRACIAREFTVWALGQPSTITVWLRALAHLAHQECGGTGVGAVGMCLTGGFALAMMVDDVVTAPVLSQPSLPLAVTAARKRDVGLDDVGLARCRERVAEGVAVLGLRFTHDPHVPDARFERLRSELGDGFIAVEIDSGPGNPHGISRMAHSVLTQDFVDEPDHPTYRATQRVVDFFRERLASPDGQDP